ncbi:hypothetical protein [Acidiphilium acidophilum]|uniref:hypothetical protein n=1 Tax=Acidiphilium acidophilum TaxID=76588 RepID=UPI002E8E6934|nr:hypothetical protein [Acidiphilium acidophilum]
MTRHHPTRTILFFRPDKAIPPPLPIIKPMERAAKVQGGSTGAVWHALPSTDVSMLAALRLVASFDVFIARSCNSWPS